MLPTLIQGLFPVTCQLCRRPGQWCCDQHRPFLPAPKSRVTYQYLDDIWAATAYRDPAIKRLIEFFKFRHGRTLTPTLANIMIENIPNEVWTSGILVPIPLHWQRQLWRGFNQSNLLAQELQRINPTIQLENNCLKRVKKTQQQAKLSLKDREINMKYAFEIINNPPSIAILLDDVVASGQTLDEAAWTLKQAGAKKVLAVVIARGGWL